MIVTLTARFHGRSLISTTSRKTAIGGFISANPRYTYVATGAGLGKIVQYRKRGPWGRQSPPKGRPPPWRQRRRTYDPVKVALLTAILTASGALVIHEYVVADGFQPTNLYAAVSSIGKPFGLCRAGYQANCVIDGDTIDYMGQRIRMVDYDTPEIGEPKCASEEAQGHKAKRRLLENTQQWTCRGDAPRQS